MTLDIRGSLKNTRINHNHYVVIDELFSNAVDSYLIRKNIEKDIEGLQVKFLIEFFDQNLFDKNKVDMRITCTDNGAGFGDEQTKAFVTKDTSYKDDLSISGVGKCKGSGRVQFFHYFSKLKINSVYKNESNYINRKLDIDLSVKEIDKDSFITTDPENQIIATTFILDTIKPEIQEKIFSSVNIKADFSVTALKQHLIIAFLQRFVSLKENIENFCIILQSKYNEEESKETLILDDLPAVSSEKEMEVYRKNEKGENLTERQKFKVFHYKLDKNKFNLQRNTVALCAKSSTVKFITNRYLKTKHLQNNDIDGYYHVVLIESEYLDIVVNEQRDDFEIPSSFQSEDAFSNNLISFDDIYDHIDDYIFEILSPPNWEKEIIIGNINNKYGISSNMIAEANVRIRYGDTEESVVRRVLSSYQEKIIQDTSDIFDMKQEIAKMEPTGIAFREKINELAWKYTSSLKSIDMANLSQVIVRRAAILEILDLAVNKNLKMQIENTEKQQNEKIIHNIFFPMQKDSKEIEDHDIWILNEEYHYYEYISSDKQLAAIKLSNNVPLFEADIDIELQKIFEKNYGENTKKRPDIAIFNNEGSVIIIEFKAPEVSMDAHTGDLMEYAQLLAAKSNGQLKKFYGYLIGSTINSNRVLGFTRFPSGKGWFGTHEVTEHTSGRRIGELYSEILFYEDIVERAKKRLETYKNKLNLSIK